MSLEHLDGAAPDPMSGEIAERRRQVERKQERVHKGTLQEQLRSWAVNRRNYRHLHLGADLLDRAADRIDELEMRLELLSPNPRPQSREARHAGR